MLLLFLLLVLILSIPAVQTRIGKYATDKINAEFGTNINIEAVGLQLNGDVELRNIYIEDYRKDTLVNIIELNTSILNFKKLYEGKLTFGDIDIEGLTLNIKTYKDEPQTNLDVFVARFDDDQPTDDPSSFLMSSSDVTITNGVFRMLDENKETETILDFDNIFINATNFLINGSDVSMLINTLAFHDSRGLKMGNLTTNFKYTLEDMTFEDLNITTENSKLKGDLKFLYEREDLQYFTDKVNIEATFTESDIALNELNTFYNEFGTDQRAKMQVEISGTLNNLRAKDLRLTTSSRSRIYGDISFLNLMNPAEDNFEMDGNFTNLSSNYNDLKALLPNVLGEAIPSAFAKLGNFTIKGQTHITSSDIDTDITVNTDLGRLVSNLGMTNINNIDNASYKGKIILEDFDLGTFTEDPTIGTASVNLNLDGKGFTMENINTKLQGDIFQIGYNNYLYRDLDVSGTLKNKIFNGNLISHDPNLKLDFNGLADFSHEIYKFDFIADVQHANLRALNFVKNDSLSLFNGLVEMKMDGRSVDDAVGSITFNNTVYKNENDTYEFKDFAVTSSFNGTERTIDINSPDIIEGKLSGEFKFADIGKLVQNSLGSMFSNYIPHKVKTEQHIDFNFKIYSKIVEVFYPDLELGPNTYIRGRLENDEKQFNLTFKSPEIKLFDYFAKDIELQLDNDNPLFNAAVEIDSVSTKFYNVSKFNLVNVTLNDTMFVRSEFNGGKNNADNFNLNFYHTVNAQNKSVIGFKTSDVTFKNNEWIINKQKDTLNKVEFDKTFKDFSISKLMMSHNNEQITLGGVLKDSTYKDLKLNFKDVDLAKITPEIDSLTLAGNVNGKLDILQQNGVYLPNSTITIDDFEVNKIALGSFKAHVIGNESLTNYNVDITIKDEEIPSFRAYGNIDVSDEVSNVNVDVDFNNFNLEPLNPFGQDVINNIRGLASGRARVRGNLKQPTIDGNLALNKTGLLIPYLNVDMDFADGSVVELKEQSFILKDINITDTEYKTKGVLGGSIAHTNFSDWVLDLELSTQRFLVLNTEEADDVMYYGTGFIGGTASIQGPTDQLVITVVGQTKMGTDFKIPLNDTESFGDNTFIKFLSPEEKQARLDGVEIEPEVISGLELSFDLDITQDAQIELVMDKNSGSNIVGRGIGALLIDINTNGRFNIYGDISVFEGVYNFLYGGIVQKEFHVRPGGTLSWEGDPLKARIDIEAVYTTQTNPSPLLDNPINRSIPVELEINLVGQLEKPEPEFTFNFPNLSSSVKSELEYRLESKEDRDNQALYLLSTGSFSRGLSDISVSGTITERLNGIINGIFSDGNGNFNVGVNYEVGENTAEYQTDDRLGVTLQTKISDRVLINGKVGVPVGGVNETVVAGDVEIDFLLNEEGTLTAKVFNRENSIRNFGEEIGYTQGLGISYSVDFDTFKELLQKIFKGKVKTPENEPKKEEKKEEPLTPEFVKFKSTEEEEN